MRSVWVGGALVGMGLGAWAAGCSIVPCYYGMYPYDGQTAVPLDVVITFDAGAAFPADLPALGAGITVTRVDGDQRPVEVDIEVERSAGLVYVTPLEPLAADATYRVTGIARLDIATPHQLSPLWRDTTRVEFRTSSDPTVLAAVRDVDGSLVVVLSEPLPNDAVAADLALTDAKGEPIEATVLGPWEGEPHMLVVDDGGLAYGVEFAGEPAVLYDYDVEALLGWYRSLPECSDALSAGAR